MVRLPPIIPHSRGDRRPQWWAGQRLQQSMGRLQGDADEREPPGTHQLDESDKVVGWKSRGTQAKVSLDTDCFWRMICLTWPASRFNAVAFYLDIAGTYLAANTVIQPYSWQRKWSRYARQRGPLSRQCLHLNMLMIHECYVEFLWARILS